MATANSQQHGHCRNLGVLCAYYLQAVRQGSLVQDGHFHHGVGPGGGLLAAVEGVDGLGVFQAGVAVVGGFVARLVDGEVIGLGRGHAAGFRQHAQNHGMLAFDVLVIHALHVGLGEGPQLLQLNGEVVGVVEVGLVGGELGYLALHAGQAVHYLGLVLGLEALHVLVGYAFFLKLFQRVADDDLRAVKGFAGEGQGHEIEEAGQLRVLLVGLGLHRFLGFHQVFVEQRGFAAADDVGQRVEGYGVGVAIGHRWKHHLQHREADVVGVAHVAVGGEHGFGQLLHRHRRAALDGAEVLLHQLHHFGGLHVAAHGEGGVVGAVPAQEEIFEVLYVRAVQVFEVADGEPGVGMAVGVEGFRDVLAGQAVGAVVVVLAALVLHGRALNLKLLLAHGVEQEAHAVGFQPQAGFELVVGQGLEVVGAVLGGAAVESAAGGRHQLKVLLVAHVVGALEHHVLEEVRKARLANLLAGRAHVVGHVHVHQRVGVVFAHDEGEAVGQHVFLVGNHYLAGLPGYFLDQPGAVGRGHQGRCFRGRGLGGRLFLLGEAGRGNKRQAQG